MKFNPINQNSRKLDTKYIYTERKNLSKYDFSPKYRFHSR